MYDTKEELLHRAHELVNARKSFRELDAMINRIAARNKGDLGQIVEEAWFHQAPHPDADPDFPNIGVELKVSPYKRLQNGDVSAKERLVCDIINYVEEAGKTFETSSFWHKCRCILLLSYLWSLGVDKADMYVDKATLLDGYPEEDLLIIKQDWAIIHQKIVSGQAHTISEGDTRYLAACTKGANSNSLRAQYHSSIPAMQRAYSLKSSYMTRLLRLYVFGGETDEHIIPSANVLKTKSFDDVVLERFQPYIGKRRSALLKTFHLEDCSAKNINALLISRMLNVGDFSKTVEFRAANIQVKTVNLQPDGRLNENISFPPYHVMDLLQQEEWEDSDLYEDIVSPRFLFVIFRKTTDAGTDTVLEQAFFWNMPAQDTETVRQVWEETKQIYARGVELWREGNVVKNNLPKQSDRRIIHVRPHVSKTGYRFADGSVIGEPDRYGDLLPDGRMMTTQSFWLNKEYTLKIIGEHDGR